MQMTGEGLRSKAPQLVLGAILMLVGVLFTLQQVQLIDLGRPVSRLWPLVLVGLGLSKLWQSWGTADSGSGAWLLLTGLWLLVVNLKVWGLTYHNSWPLLMVAAGLSLVWRSLVAGSPPERSTLDETEARNGR